MPYILQQVLDSFFARLEKQTVSMCFSAAIHIDSITIYKTGLSKNVFNDFLFVSAFGIFLKLLCHYLCRDKFN